MIVGDILNASMQPVLWRDKQRHQPSRVVRVTPDQPPIYNMLIRGPYGVKRVHLLILFTPYISDRWGVELSGEQDGPCYCHLDFDRDHLTRLSGRYEIHNNVHCKHSHGDLPVVLG